MARLSQRNLVVSAVAGVALVCLAVAVLTSREDPGSDDGANVAEPDSTLVASSTGATSTVATVVDTVEPSVTTTSVASVPSDEPCTIRSKTLNGGSSGDDVLCLQRALIDAGYLAGIPSGRYDNATAAAVKRVQTDRDLYIDGVTGRETALSLGIWPEEPDLVVRTPAPAPGAVDLLGYPLSSVATSGPDAPPLPPDSGTGRRLVYQRAGQRVWAVDENDVVIRSWLVSGSKYDNELPGVHKVYSRSEKSLAWDGKANFDLMVRWLKTSDDAIGFHALPTRVSDGTPYQTEAELGQRLSGGCQRQADLDAEFTWDFAQVGTTVVVL